MRGILVLLTVHAVLAANIARYEVHGRLTPAAEATVWMHAAASPFETTMLTDASGRFRFQHLMPGAYTLGVFVPGRGERRQTIEVGPSLADSKGHIEINLELRDPDLESKDSLRRRAMISTSELAIPPQAWRDYEEGRKKLATNDVAAAVARLQHAVEVAPRFAAAWNRLGTIAYQTRGYQRAEYCFRQALAADATAFEPLVNLGGVLINLGEFQEALDHNRHAVLTHPGDALANSQLGMTYFFLHQLQPAEKYLEAARRLDPAHFSHPQLMLADIHLRQNEPAEAARDLEEFLHHHPDWPDAERVRRNIARLRSAQP